jgi:hypothetical protein
MAETDHEIVLDGTKYMWRHVCCHCFGHCNSDEFFVDGEPYGTVDNPELCSFIAQLIEIAKKGEHGIA